jgi:hypothetical protein
MIVASFGVLYLRSEFVGHLDQRGRFLASCCAPGTGIIFCSYPLYDGMCAVAHIMLYMRTHGCRNYKVAVAHACWMGTM